MTLKEQYEKKKPIGVYPMSNWGGLVLYLPEERDCDYISAFDFGNGLKSCRKTFVKFSDSGRPYINKCGSRYYLDEVMRCE